MATGRMSKKTKSLQDLHRFLDDKASEVELEREEDRTWSTKEHLVNGLLNKKYLVTLDYDVKYHDWVIEMGFNQNTNFISQISVKLPHIKELNYNACIKIDDADFDHSNAGVWIHQVHDLLDRDKFTDWTKYNDDNPADEVDK